MSIFFSSNKSINQCQPRPQTGIGCQKVCLIHLSTFTLILEEMYFGSQNRHDSSFKDKFYAKIQIQVSIEWSSARKNSFYKSQWLISGKM